MIKFPVYRPCLAGNEKKYVMECLDSTWISSKGRFVDEFEKAFAAFIDVPHGVSVCNGTAALHVALLALGIGPGDEVIVPSLTYIASANAIRYTGAVPVFADVRPDTWQIDPADAEARITPKTRAIMAVHLFGHPCEMQSLAALAAGHGLSLVEDCAEAFGSRYQGRHVGGHGHIATFSFFGNKTITTGEGGMVVARDAELIERASHIKGQGLARNREYWHDIIGYNYRMTNICAAIGLAQMERAEELIARKREIAGWYGAGLADVPFSLQGEIGDVVNSYWMISGLVARAALRDPLRAFLAAAGIETRPFFFPVHTMAMYAGATGALPVTEDLSARGITLPSWPELRKEDVAEICGQVKRGLDAAQ
jgi:perosamine synthetase